MLPRTTILRQVHGRKQIAFLTAHSQAKHCRCQTSILSDASVQRFNQDAGQAGRQGKTCQAPLHAAVCSNAIEQQCSALNGLRWRSIQPIEIVNMRDLHRPQAEQKLGEITANDLGRVALQAQPTCCCA